MTKEVSIPSKEELLDVLEDSDNNDVDTNETDSNEGGDPEYTEVELKAIEMGWNPEGVEGKRNKSAEEFVENKQVYDDLHAIKKHNKSLQKDIENIIKYQDRIRQDERNKVLSELKDSKKQALKDEDYDRVVEIDEEIAEARKETKDKQATQSNDAFDTWLSDNKWYNADREMRGIANGIGDTYIEDHPNTPLKDIYNHVSKRIKELYPDKFNKKRASAAPTVDSASSATASKRQTKSKYSAKDLSPDERSIMRTIVRTSGLSEEEYLNSYFSQL